MDNLEQLDSAEQSTDEQELSDAYAQGFFDDPHNVHESSKELYAQILGEFYTSDKNITLDKNHRQWFENHLPTSALVIDNLKKSPYLFQIGEKPITIDHTARSVHFIRGLIQTVEKSQKNSNISLESQTSGTNRDTILKKYSTYLKTFMEQYSEPFDKVFYMREEKDEGAFNDPHQHRIEYQERGITFTEYKQGTDIADGAELAAKVKQYCSDHPEERVMLYLGGHGSQTGKMIFDGGYDAEIHKEIFEELLQIPNLTLELDSCYTGHKLKGNQQEVEAIMTNSEFDTAKNSFDRCLFEGKAWKTDKVMLETTYPNLTSLIKTYHLDDTRTTFFDATNNYLFGLNKYEIGFSIGSGYLSGIDTSPLRSNTKEEVQGTIQRLESLLTHTKNTYDKPIGIEFKDPGNPGLPFFMPVSFVIDLLKSATYQHADYDQNGKVSYAESRLYAMQNYTHSFLPTVYRNKVNNEYIKIAEPNEAIPSEFDSPNTPGPQLEG